MVGVPTVQDAAYYSFMTSLATDVDQSSKYNASKWISIQTYNV